MPRYLRFETPRQVGFYTRRILADRGPGTRHAAAAVFGDFASRLQAEAHLFAYLQATVARAGISDDEQPFIAYCIRASTDRHNGDGVLLIQTYLVREVQ